METTTKKIKLPFPVTIMDDEPMEVKNPYTGEGCMLTPEAIAVYDTIKGAEMVGLWKVVRKGLDWFRRHYAREYMILLD